MLLVKTTIKGAQEAQEDTWEDIRDIPKFVTPYLILAPDDLDHNEARRILKDENMRLKSTRVETFTYKRPPMEG